MKMSLFSSVLLAFFGWLCLTLCYVVEFTVACVSTEPIETEFPGGLSGTFRSFKGEECTYRGTGYFFFKKKGRKCAFEANSI